MLAEAAYYRLVFWQGMAVAPASGLTTQHTLFGGRFKTERGLRLQKPPFDSFPGACWPTLELSGNTGARNRDARRRCRGIRVPLGPGSGRRHEFGHFTPVALSAPRPVFAEAWLCETSSTGVVFYSQGSRQILNHPIEIFLVDGVCPCPQSDGHLVVRMAVAKAAAASTGRRRAVEFED